MQLPYKPQSLFHSFGGRILEITKIVVQTERPSGGHSRDFWYFIGKIEWNDGSGKPDTLHPIDMYLLCCDDDTGRAEVRALSDLMMAHLNEHGVWNDKGPHQGWYANRSAKPGTEKSRRAATA